MDQDCSHRLDQIQPLRLPYWLVGSLSDYCTFIVVAVPGVDSNSKYRCGDCGSIFDFDPMPIDPGPCSNCGAREWKQIVVVTVCDFCSSTEARWRFACQSFSMAAIAGGPERLSDCDWSACTPCKELIEANKMTKLSRRATRRAIRRHPEMKSAEAAIEAGNRHLHQQFKAHCQAPAVLIDAEPAD